MQFLIFLIFIFLILNIFRKAHITYHKLFTQGLSGQPEKILKKSLNIYNDKYTITKYKYTKSVNEFEFSGTAEAEAGNRIIGASFLRQFYSYTRFYP